MARSPPLRKRDALLLAPSVTAAPGFGAAAAASRGALRLRGRTGRLPRRGGGCGRAGLPGRRGRSGGSLRDGLPLPGRGGGGCRRSSLPLPGRGRHRSLPGGPAEAVEAAPTLPRPARRYRAGDRRNRGEGDDVLPDRARGGKAHEPHRLLAVLALLRRERGRAPGLAGDTPQNTSQDAADNAADDAARRRLLPLLPTRTLLLRFSGGGALLPGRTCPGRRGRALSGAGLAAPVRSPVAPGPNPPSGDGRHRSRPGAHLVLPCAAPRPLVSVGRRCESSCAVRLHSRRRRAPLLPRSVLAAPPCALLSSGLSALSSTGPFAGAGPGVGAFRPSSVSARGFPVPSNTGPPARCSLRRTTARTPTAARPATAVRDQGLVQRRHAAPGAASRPALLSRAAMRHSRPDGTGGIGSPERAASSRRRLGLEPPAIGAGLQVRREKCPLGFGRFAVHQRRDQFVRMPGCRFHDACPSMHSLSDRRARASRERTVPSARPRTPAISS